MAKKAIIDKDILGWGDQQNSELLQQYEEILQVSKDPNLPSRIFDTTIASYCRDNDCDLFTSDRTAFTHYYKIGVRRVEISEYDWWYAGNRPVYLVKIIE